MKDLIKRILREETRGELNNRARQLLDNMAAASLKNVADDDVESMRNALKDVEESGINWNKDVVKSVKQTYDDLMIRAKEILREEKKKNLFVPRNLENRRIDYEKKVKETNNKFLIDNDIDSLKYSIKINKLWDDLEYDDIYKGIINRSVIILNNGNNLHYRNMFTKINHSDFIDYSHVISGYLNYLIMGHNPKNLSLNDLEIDINSSVNYINFDIIFTINNFNRLKKANELNVINFTKTL